MTPTLRTMILATVVILLATGGAVAGVTASELRSGETGSTSVTGVLTAGDSHRSPDSVSYAVLKDEDSEEATTTTATLKIGVLARDGTPAANATVFLWNESGNKVGSKIFDEALVKWTSLKPGTYRYGVHSKNGDHWGGGSVTLESGDDKRIDVIPTAPYVNNKQFLSVSNEEFIQSPVDTAGGPRFHYRVDESLTLRAAVRNNESEQLPINVTFKIRVFDQDGHPIGIDYVSTETTVESDRTKTVRAEYTPSRAGAYRIETVLKADYGNGYVPTDSRNRTRSRFVAWESLHSIAEYNWAYNSSLSRGSLNGDILAENGLDGTGTTVALLIEGIDSSSPAVNPVYRSDTEWKPDKLNVIDVHDPDGSDIEDDPNDEYHGWQVATSVWQFAPNASYIVVNMNQSGKYGIDWVADNYNPDVIVTSTSYEGSKESTFLDRFSDAADRDTMVVVSAGNLKDDDPAHYPVVPSTAEGVLSVSSTNRSSGICVSSSPGNSTVFDRGADPTKPDIAAPGCEVAALGTIGSDLNGSSFAAPNAAGALAQLLQHAKTNGKTAADLKLTLPTVAISTPTWNGSTDADNNGEVSDDNLDGAGQLMPVGAYHELLADDHVPAANVTVEQVHMTSTSVTFRIHLNETRGADVYSGGVYLAAVGGGTFETINFGDFHSGNNFTRDGTNIVELYSSTGNVTSGNITLAVSDSVSTDVAIRGWLSDYHDAVYNPYLGRYDRYVARDPAENRSADGDRYVQGETWEQSTMNPPFNRHLGPGSFNITDYTTKPAGLATDPGLEMPSLSSPADGEREVSTGVTLSWKRNNPDVMYDVYLEKGARNPKLVAEDQTSTSFDPEGLEKGTTYYWKVVAKDGDGNTAESDAWSFTTIGSENAPPNQPSNPTPVDGADNIATSLTLAWSGNDDPDGDSVMYEVYFGTSSDPSFYTSTSSTSLTVDGLKQGTTYYWKVVADDGIATNSSRVWSFTTSDGSGGSVTVDDFEFRNKDRDGSLKIQGGSPSRLEEGYLEYVISSDSDGEDYDLRVINERGIVIGTLEDDAYDGDRSAVTLDMDDGGDLFRQPGTHSVDIILHAHDSGDTVRKTTSAEVELDRNEDDVTVLPTTPQKGETVTLDASAISEDSSGDSIEGYEWTIFKNPDGVATVVKEASGKSLDTISFTPEEAAKYRFKLVNDPDETTGTVIDSDDIFVEESAPTPSLDVEGFSVPGTVVVGNSFSASVDLKNSGDAQANYLIRFKIGGKIEEVEYADVDADDSRSDRASFSLPAGAYEITAVIIDGQNNTHTRTRTVTVESNAPPESPTAPSPSDGATDVTAPETTLEWDGTDPDGDSLNYTVRLEKGDKSPDTVVVSDLPSASYVPTTLNTDSIYYWQVIAEDEHGETTSGPVWSFTTEGESRRPTAKLSVTPSTPSVGDTVTLDASESTTETGDPTYEWRVVESPDGVDIEAPSGANGSVTLAEPGTYEFEVTVSDGTASNSTTVTIEVASDALHPPFSEEFEDDIAGWTVGLNESWVRDRVDAGAGSWSSKYGGSVRLHVNGGPNHVGLYRELGNVEAGTRIVANYESSNLEGSPGGPRLNLHTPDGEKIQLDKDTGGGGSSPSEYNGTLVGTVPEDLPAGTYLEFRLGVWPGEITVYVENISVDEPDADETLFVDMFDDGTYEDRWRITEQDDETIRESNGTLLHDSPKTYTDNGNMVSSRSLTASGVTTITVRQRVVESDYWGAGFYLAFGNGSIFVKEHKWGRNDEFRVRVPGSGKRSLGPPTDSTDWINYTLIVDFENMTLLSVSRGDEVYDVGMPIEGIHGDEYRIGLGNGRGHRIRYDFVRVDGSIEPNESRPDPLHPPFSEGFENDTAGWRVGLNESWVRDSVAAGTGSWSSKHDGSVRLHVDGDPNHVGLYRELGNIEAGTRIVAHYESSDLEGSPGGPRLNLHTPDGDTIQLDKDTGGGGSHPSEHNGTLVGTVPRDLPAGTYLEFRLGVWSGEITVYVENISVGTSKRQIPAATSTYLSFEDGIRDVSGADREVTDHGADLVDGFIGQGIELDASEGDYLTAESNLSGGAFTYSAWVNIEEHIGNDIFTNHGDRRRLYVDTDGKLCGRMWGGNGPNEGDSVCGGRVPLDTWTHVAFVFDGSTGVVYLDGRRVASMDWDGYTGGTKTCIGSHALGGDCEERPGNFEGRLDEWLIVDSALTTEQVKQLSQWKSDTTDGEDPVVDGFEDGSFEDTWDVWKNQPEGYGKVVDSIARFGNRSLKMHAGSTYSGDFRIGHNFSASPANGETFSTWIHPNSTDVKAVYQLFNHNTSAQAKLVIQPFGSIDYRTDQTSEQTLVSSYSANTWYKLSITVYPSNDTVAFQVEDTNGTQWSTSPASGTVNFTAVGVFAGDYSGNTDFHVDNAVFKPRGTETKTCIAEAVSGDDDTISLTEIQEAINWWAEGSEVPEMGGETISLSKIQSLINAWAEGTTVSCAG